MEQPAMSLKEGCMLVLHYFGIFRHPLTAEEIYLFNPVKATREQTGLTLREMVDEGVVQFSDGFYLAEDCSEAIGKRQLSNTRARRLLQRSVRYVSVIASFPFVRSIAISGSLSKFSASENPDIDYFIITETGRLWIARSFLHLFKKLTFITGHQHYFCMNYFIDTDAMTITHQNRYSAIEVMTLLPVFNAPLHEEFYRKNEWAGAYLPNHPGPVNYDYLWNGKSFFCKIAMEKLINLIFPEKLNRLLMNITDRKWRRKWKRAGYPAEDYDRAFMTTLHISKNHPVDYEKKVLSKLKENSLVE